MPYKGTDRHIRPRGDTKSKSRPSQQEEQKQEEEGVRRHKGRRKRKSWTEDKGVEAYIHVDDRLIGTVDGGEQGVGATGVEGQQRRRVAGVWTSVPSVVPCHAQRSCTVMTKLGIRHRPYVHNKGKPTCC